MERYLLSLGSNISDKEKNIKEALQKITESGIKITEISRFYTSSPVDYTAQDDFINMCAIAETDFLPLQLLGVLKNIEKTMGRVKTFEKGPRIIDIDIILWSGGNFESDSLKIPHPSWQDRLFVLIPASEILSERDFFPKELVIIKNLLDSERFEGQIVRKLS